MITWRYINWSFGTNHNRYTQRLVTLHADAHNYQWILITNQSPRRSDHFTGQMSPKPPKIDANRHFQAELHSLVLCCSSFIRFVTMSCGRRRLSWLMSVFERTCWSFAYRIGWLEFAGLENDGRQFVDKLRLAGCPAAVPLKPFAAAKICRQT